MSTTFKHVIDCDADPYLPSGWKVESHRKQGQFEFGLEKVQLYLSEGQKPGKYVEGNKLRKEIEDQLVLNANVLDYLLAHPELIPESWKDKAIFFWGTVYRDSDNDLYARCLYWDGKRWDWDDDWLGNSFSLGDPTAVAGK